MYELIPEELKKLRHWVCWRAEPDPKAHSGISKKPINPKTGHLAQSNNPDTWTDFDTAERVSRDYAGIGFMFENSGYFGVDLDDMYEELEQCKKGNFSNSVGEFITTLQSYTELSQSGNGIHIICKGKLPSGARRNGKFEMYDSGRFFVMTGNCAFDFIDIHECSESIQSLHQKYLQKSKEYEKPESGQLSLININLSVPEILERAKNSINGAKFESLYSGDISDYPSQSEADMAFCNMLAFWCAGDAEKMDGIYRSSGLMRKKWDRKQSGSTYGNLVIQRAIKDCKEFYTSNQPIVTDHSLKIRKKSDIPAKSQKLTEKMYKFDDTGNAERLFDMFGETFRYSYTEHKYLYYLSGKWHFDNIGYERKIADIVISELEKDINLYADDEKLKKAFLKHCNKSRSFTGKTNMLKEAQHYAPVLPEMLDRSKTIIGVKNGIIDLRKGSLMPHDKNAFLTKQIALEYIPDAKSPELWIKFLDEIFQSDKELIRYIQKALGYSLTGSTQEQCAFFLYGTGRNGKSTFLEIIRNILGDYASNIQPETIMVNQKSGNAPTSDIARLKGARFVTSVEPNEGMKLNEGLIKQMTGGDVMTVRKLFCAEFEFRPEFKLWMATNHKPVIRETDTGIWRRVHMIPFMACIPENRVDTHLIYKLAKESSQIFKWMLDGCLLWQREGLSMPKAVHDAVKEYQHEMDVIKNFIDACCIENQGETKASVLYAVYAQWCRNNGEYCMSNTKFGVEMQKKCKKIKKPNGIYYLGIEIEDSCKQITIGQ